eukprot:symbB.v1.2.020087.t1/scaffold1671.1/size106526/1
MAEEADEAPKEWRDLKFAFLDLDEALGRLSSEKPTKEAKDVGQLEARQRLPSVFSASCEGDLKLLNRCYSPNIFAWDLCRVGVEDDVDDLQLRVAYRLRRRGEALQQSDLEQLRRQQRQEMREADDFMEGFDSQHWITKIQHLNSRCLADFSRLFRTSLMGGLPCVGSRGKDPAANPPSHVVDWAEAQRRAKDVRTLPGPYEELEHLLGDRFQTPQKDRYHTARGVLGIEDVAWNGRYRATWNPDAIGYPCAIAMVETVKEVQQLVTYAAKHCLPNGVRLCVAAGRHSHMCMLDNTLVLDLQGLSSVEIFPEQLLAKVAGGAQQGQLDVACEAYNLATTAGHNASTGCGGLILQGGHGFLERMFGLVIDNLVEVEVVLADGTLVKANAQEHEDLFWAVRGGGGNFGVVVSFTLRLHPLGPTYAGTQVHKAFDGPSREEVMTKFFEKTLNGPDEATGLIVLPCGGPVVEMLVWIGSPTEGQQYFEQRPPSGPLLRNTLGVKSYHSDIQRFSDPEGSGKAVHQTGVLLPEWSKEAAMKLAELV